MPFVDKESLLKAQSWRYAVKTFDATKKISPDLWQALEESLRLTPSSYGLQPWKFISVKSQAIREKLRQHSWNQSQVTDASHLVVFCHKKSMDLSHIEKFIAATARTRNIPLEKLDPYKNIMKSDLVDGPRSKIIPIWTSRQVYIALGNFMTSAALLGIDTCPLEGLDPQKYDEILGLEGSDYATVCACAAGYRSEADKSAGAAKVRFHKSEVIFEV